MEFPRLVFKSPGLYTCNGGTYGYVPVKDEAEYDAALAAGYSATVPEALAAAARPKAAEPPKAEAPKKETLAPKTPPNRARK